MQSAPPICRGMRGLYAISPALKAAMPAAQKKARRQIDVLTRAKKRLMELMEEPQK